MTTHIQQPELVADATFQVASGPPGFRRALLINPPVYDAQYWARWSQPAGLLRVASLLRRKGYDTRLIDCMETDAAGNVPKTWRKGPDGKSILLERDDTARRVWHFGLTWDALDKRLKALDWDPDEVWITSIMTYWWQSTRDMVLRVRQAFPKAKVLVGGIYPTLAPEHTRDSPGPHILHLVRCAKCRTRHREVAWSCCNGVLDQRTREIPPFRRNYAFRYRSLRFLWLSSIR